MKPRQANILCTQLDIPEPCPKSWQRLAPTQNKQQRHCASCQQTVYLCLTEAEGVAHTQQGHCIAVPRNGFEAPMDWMNMTMGRSLVIKDEQAPGKSGDGPA